MSLNTIKTLIMDLPQRDYTEITGWLVGPERRRRQQETGKAELVLEERAAGIRDEPAATVPEDQADDPDAYTVWKDPGVVHDRMYGLGDRVCHQGRIWESTHRGLNHWEPGVEGVHETVWQDVTGLLADPIPGAAATFPEEDKSPAPEEDAAPPAVPEWRTGLAVIPGEQLLYQGTVYTVVQSHTTQAGWEPPVVPALYSA